MELVQIGSPEGILMERDLKDPIDLTPSVRDAIVKTTKEYDENPADIWVYFVWSIKGAIGRGGGGSPTAFISDEPGATSFSDEALIGPAHEIGHVFGLDHILLEGFLMFPHRPRGGLEMTMIEIDKVNPSGVDPIKPIQAYQRWAGKR
jgi:hypothetical protein